MNKVSVIIPTLNEEDRVGRALESAKFADEILVIDSFSKDNTIEIAKSYEARIIQRVFDDFSSQKNYAINQASFDWIVVLDADEVITEELQKEIVEKASNPKGNVGFYIYRSFFIKDKRIRFSGTQNDKLIRFFNRKRCHYQGVVHEKIKAKGKVGVMEGRLLHYSYKSFDHFISKLNLYATLKAKSIYRKNIFLNPYHFVIKPIARFVKHYLIQLGFLDGFYGFLIACLHSYGVFARYVKLWQMKYKIKKRV